jgi:phosphate starvation-inducible protein PhoH
VILLRSIWLVQIQNILKNVDGVSFVYLDKKDVVRHRLVKDIINAYEEFSVKNNGGSEKEELERNSNDKNSKELSQ